MKINDEQIKNFIDRVERIDGEISEKRRDKTEIFREAKAQGYEPKYLKKIIRLRKMDPSKRQEDEEMTQIYKDAAGVT